MESMVERQAAEWGAAATWTLAGLGKKRNIQEGSHRFEPGQAVHGHAADREIGPRRQPEDRDSSSWRKSSPGGSRGWRRPGMGHSRAVQGVPESSPWLPLLNSARAPSRKQVAQK